MKLRYNAVILLMLSFLAISCEKYLDVPPKNVVQDQDLFSSNQGMMVYLSRIYSQMPYEDFKYSPGGGFFHDWLVSPGVNEGTSIGRDRSGAMTGEAQGNWNFWEGGYRLMRDINRMIEVLPTYKDNFPENEYKHFMGEAYFARGYLYYSFAKRYGGVPIVKSVLKYPEQAAAELEVPRATEEETWNQALADMDSATTLLAENSPQRGMVNRYVALAFRSSAALYAGSIAKYNTLTGFGQKTKVRVMGFDPATAPAVSKMYFAEAYKSAMAIVKSNKYSLFKKRWAAGDMEAMTQNMIDMFFDASSPENIFVKDYKFPDLAHGFDSYNIPRQLMGGNGYSSSNNPTLEYVSLFDGIPKNADSSIKVFDGGNKYIMYDNITDLFKNAEPRLKAFVILPGEQFKGQAIDIRMGIFTGEAGAGIAPLRTKNGQVDYSLAGIVKYNETDAFRGTGAFSTKSLFVSSQQGDEIVTLPNGTTTAASGRSGPFTNDATGAMTGFTIRKYLNPNMPQSLVLEARSEQSFILMRFAEVLLNLAEASAELALAGQQSPDENQLNAVMLQSINAIRERAGASLASAADLVGQNGLALIRKERTKELAFEHKTLWDIRRWRTQTTTRINGATQEDGTFYSGLYPFYSTKANKYFFDPGPEIFRIRFRMTYPEYYFLIPGDQVNKSPVIDQQPGR